MFDWFGFGLVWLGWFGLMNLEGLLEVLDWVGLVLGWGFGLGFGVGFGWLGFLEGRGVKKKAVYWLIFVSWLIRGIKRKDASCHPWLVLVWSLVG